MCFFRILCYLVVMVTMRTTTNSLNTINAFVPKQILIISNKKRFASMDTSSSFVDQTHGPGARRLFLLLQVGTSKETELIPPQFRPGSLEEATAKMGKVPYGEASRRYRRTEFVYDDWVKHRTSEKIFTNLNGLLYSGIVRQLKEELFYISVSAAFVVGWDDFLLPFTAAHTKDFWMISTLPRLCIPALPFQLCSPALGLLLVFKTNASYARWLEARNTWAKVITQARNMVRMAATFVPHTEEGKRSIRNLSETLWLLCRSIMHDLSGPNDEGCFRDQVTAKFEDGAGDDQEDRQYTRKMIESSERSMTALALASAALDSVPIDEKRRVEIDKSLVIIGDCIGIFEKIYSAPVPLVCKLILRVSCI